MDINKTTKTTAKTDFKAVDAFLLYGKYVIHSVKATFVLYLSSKYIFLVFICVVMRT